MEIKIAPGKAFLFFFFPTKELDGTADFFFNLYLPNIKGITDI